MLECKHVETPAESNCKYKFAQESQPVGCGALSTSREKLYLPHTQPKIRFPFSIISQYIIHVTS